MTAALMVAFVVGLFVGLPVSIVMGISSLIAVQVGGTYPLLVLPQRLFGGIDSFPLMAVPLFILAADLMTAGKLTDALLRHANVLVGHVRGGLGHVNVLSSMFFAGISGSALADAAGPGAIELDMMRRAGYPAPYSGAMTAATAVIGPIIPPSIIMVVYAVTDNRVTVAALFLAGILPGVLLGLAVSIVNHVISTRNRYQFASKWPTWREIVSSFWPALPGLLMPVIILGGILGGVFTATEAAAVAVAYAMLAGLFITRNLAWKDIPGVFLRSGLLTSAVLLIVSMASIFSWLLTILRVPQGLATWITGLTDERVVVLILMNLFILACGMFIDTLPAVIILAPILSPIAASFDIHPLQFAMILVLNLAIGMITPPVGPVLFVVSTVGKLRFERIAKAVLPFLAAELVVLTLVTFIPALSVQVPMWFGYAR